MIDLAILIAAPFIASGFSFVIGKAKARVVTKTVIDNQPICPYCNVSITGIQSLDIINHVGCITKSADDIKAEHERKIAQEEIAKAEAAKRTGTQNDKYQIQYEQVTSARTPAEYNLWSYDHTASVWTRFKWTVIRNGQAIHTGFSKNRETAGTHAKAWVKIDKKRIEIVEV